MNLATLPRCSAADHAGQVALRLDESEVGVPLNKLNRPELRKRFP